MCVCEIFMINISNYLTVNIEIRTIIIRVSILRRKNNLMQVNTNTEMIFSYCMLPKFINAGMLLQIS